MLFDVPMDCFQMCCYGSLGFELFVTNITLKIFDVLVDQLLVIFETLTRSKRLMTKAALEVSYIFMDTFQVDLEAIT